MKIAIPIYNESVSNVFDFATHLLLVDIENDTETNRSEVVLGNQSLQQRADQLKVLGVDVLVCGAISRELENMVATAGIEILPYVTGRVDDVLQAYLTGQLVKPEFSMPGFWPDARRGFGRRRGGCHWRNGQR